METSIKLSRCAYINKIECLSMGDKIKILNSLINYTYDTDEARVFDFKFDTEDAKEFTKLYGTITYNTLISNGHRFAIGGFYYSFIADNTKVTKQPIIVTEDNVVALICHFADEVGETIDCEISAGGWDVPMERVRNCLTDDYIFGSYFDFNKFLGIDNEPEMINVYVTRSYSIPKSEYEKAKSNDFKDEKWLTQTISLKNPDEE